MNQDNRDKIFLALSMPLALLVAVEGYSGAFVSSTFSRETASYAAQGIGQDFVNLFIAFPFLIVTAILSYKGSKHATFMWSGIVFYLAYSFAIYSFATHFNFLFLVYCLIFGISFYSFVSFVLLTSKEPVNDWFDDRVPTKSVGIFFIASAALFYFVWLSEIIPAIIGNKVPASIVEGGLLTNPVHVLDIAIALPGLVITAIFLFRRKPLGLMLAPAFLVFITLMAVAIIAMVIAEHARGIQGDMSVAAIFGIITFVSILLLMKFLRSLKNQI